MEVFILRNLKLFRMNTYRKHRGRGVMINLDSLICNPSVFRQNTPSVLGEL